MEIIVKIILKILFGIAKVLFLHDPKLAGLFGLVFTCVFASIGANIWWTEKNVPRVPIQQAASFLAAHGESRVIIEGVTWDCRNVFHYSDGSRDDQAIFTNASQSIIGVASFSRGISCGLLRTYETNVDGFLRKMDDKYYKSLPQRRFNLTDYRNPSTRLLLCVCSDPNNSFAGIVLCIIMAVLGLLFYPLFSMMKKDIGDSAD